MQAAAAWQSTDSTGAYPPALAPRGVRRMFRCTTSPYGSNRGRSCSSVASRGTCSRHFTLGTRQWSLGIWGHSQDRAGLKVQQPNTKDEERPHWPPTLSHLSHLAGGQPPLECSPVPAMNRCSQRACMSCPLMGLTTTWAMWDSIRGQTDKALAKC